jgi:hypothetical protein
MEISSTSQMQQMDQLQLQKRDGSGGGQGKGGGMGDIMQSLSSDDKAQLQDQMSSLSPADRQAKMNEMKQVDSTSMSSEDYVDTLMDIIGGDEEETSSADAYITEAYA